MNLKKSKFLTKPASKNALIAYLLEQGVPESIINGINLEELANSLLTVEDVIPSLIIKYPEVEPFLIEVESNSKDLTEKIKRILMNIDVYGDELGTTNVSMAIDSIFNNLIIPHEELFRIIEELPISIDELSPLVKEQYLKWKYNVIDEELPDYIINAAKLAKENLPLIIKDVSIKNIPKELTDENFLRALPSILAIGTEKDLFKVYNFIKDNNMYKIVVRDFDLYLDYLKEVVNYIEGKSSVLNIPTGEAPTVMNLFPRTTMELSEKLEEKLNKKEVTSKPIVKTASEVVKPSKPSPQTSSTQPQPQPQKPKYKKVKVGGAILKIPTKPPSGESPHLPKIAEEALKWARNHYSEQEIQHVINELKKEGYNESQKIFYDLLVQKLWNYRQP